MPEWLIEKINRFDTKYKIKNFFEITFSIISKLQVKSRKIVRQNATISQSNIIRATSLVLYKKAVERSLGRNVDEVYIYSFFLDKALKVF